MFFCRLLKIIRRKANFEERLSVEIVSKLETTRTSSKFSSISKSGNRGEGILNTADPKKSMIILAEGKS